MDTKRHKNLSIYGETLVPATQRMSLDSLFQQILAFTFLKSTAYAGDHFELTVGMPVSL